MPTPSTTSAASRGFPLVVLAAVCWGTAGVSGRVPADVRSPWSASEAARWRGCTCGVRPWPSGRPPRRRTGSRGRPAARGPVSWRA